jgi:hypothetical protein
MLAGCMGQASTGIEGTQRTDSVSYGSLTGKLTLEDSSISAIGTEVFFTRKSELSSDEDDSNIQRTPSNYDYKVLADINGNFEVERIQSGIYDIYVIKKDYSFKELSNIEVKPGIENKIEVTLDNPGKTTGKILLSNGSTKYGIAVYIGTKPVLTDENGNFTISVSPGTHELIIDEYGYERVVRVITVESEKILDLGTLMLEKTYMNPELGMINAKVISAFGFPITSADVYAVSSTEKIHEKTDSSGFFRFINIEPDTYMIKIVTEYFGTTVLAEVEAGVKTDLETVVVDNIARYGKVEITPILENNLDFNPELVVKDSNDEEVFCHIEIADTGKITLSGLNSGNYSIEFNSLRYLDKKVDFSVTAGVTTEKNIEFTLKKSLISGDVKNNSGEPVITTVKLNSLTGDTDYNGAFSFSNVESGNYTLYINAFGYQQYVENIFIENGIDVLNKNIVLSKMTGDGIFGEIALPSRVGIIKQSDDYVFALSNDKKKIYRISKKYGETETVITTDGLIEDFVIDENAVYIIDSFNNNVEKYSLANFVKLKNTSSGIEPVKIALKNENLFIVTRGDRQLYVVDKVDFSKQAYEMGFEPSGVAANQNNVFISNRLGNQIRIFDITNRIFSSYISNIIRPVDIYCGQDRIYITKENSTEIEVINSVTYVKVTTLNPGISGSKVYESDDSLYVSGDNKVALYGKSNLFIKKLLEVSDDLNYVIEDVSNQERLFISKKNEQRIIIYFCRK